MPDSPQNHILPEKNTAELSKLIRLRAAELGFDYCGFARAKSLEKEVTLLKEWIDAGYHASMEYMERNIEKRTNPAKLFENCKSVISLLHNYYPAKSGQNNDSYRISKYAAGTDYHFVIKSKLKEIIKYVKGFRKNFEARAFVDSAPVMDKVWAVKAGLGWIGKNTCLINRKSGSWFFIGEILCNQPLDYNNVIQKDLCGSCTRCISACPAGAITKPYVIDAHKCISYQTIENKQDIPVSLKGKLENYIFGCDICQEVCPWNKFSKPHREPEFNLPEELAGFKKEDWKNMNRAEFNRIFKKSPLKRTGFEKIKNTIAFIEERNSISEKKESDS